MWAGDMTQPSIPHFNLKSKILCLYSAYGILALFCKVLTASDTSTHNGFLVIWKQATECLLALYMNEDTPTQETDQSDPTSPVPDPATPTVH
ncbi:hypothetical protein L1987_70839 [Smallanthus sonchifolius]|uniref:Uncharacterized protein n=1 Tax=Smallanthus sonchifolius TaxID=185202 RepID=A0ACB9AR42_9ASTR|nr:hypothetical protein L1987_70839 [Smallanthus sonchifolius]